MSYPDTPKIALPFRRTPDGKRIEVNEQGDFEDVASQVQITVMTRRGSRIENPDFGIPEQAFREGGADLDAVAAALDQWVPDADAVLSRDPEILADIVDEVNVKLRRRGEADA